MFRRSLRSTTIGAQLTGVVATVAVRTQATAPASRGATPSHNMRGFTAVGGSSGLTSSFAIAGSMASSPSRNNINNNGGFGAQSAARTSTGNNNTSNGNGGGGAVGVGGGGSSSTSCSGSSSNNSVTADGRSVCVLCDEPFDDWAKHSSKIGHKARQAICRRYVVPERHEAIMSQLWDHIQLDFGLVDQVNNKKVDRRRMKLSGTMGYLVEQGVLYDSVPTASAPGEGDSAATTDAAAAGYDVSRRFPILVSVGESYLLSEATQRLSRLMPKASAEDVRIIGEFLTHPRQLRGLFEMLQMGAIVANGGSTAPSVEVGSSNNNTTSVLPLKPNEKVATLLAMLGELKLYAAKERKHSVANKVVADELVLNVLANHCCENLVSELVHTTLQRVVDEGTPVWNEYRASVQDYLFASSQAADKLSLSEMPTAPLTQQKAAELFGAVTAEDVLGAVLRNGSSSGMDAATAANTEAFKNAATSVEDSASTCKLLWGDVTKAGALDSLPFGVTASTKLSGFAPMMPRLNPRMPKKL